MKLEDIRGSVEAGEELSTTRPTWNNKKLEFWVKIVAYSAGVPHLSDFAVGFSKVPSAKREKQTVTHSYIECYTKCKDGTEVPDAFELTLEDLEADDWVII